MKTLTYAEFRKQHPAVRCFQQYDHETRAMHAASGRLGHRQRADTGAYFYTHPLAPYASTGDEVAYGTAKEATTAAFRVYQERFALTHVLADLDE